MLNISVLCSLAATGCGVGEITMESWTPMEPAMADAGPAEMTAQDYFAAELDSVFEPCSTCHASENAYSGAPNFLLGWPNVADVREHIFTSSNLNLLDMNSPEHSGLLAPVEMHPAELLDDDESAKVIRWIELEREERGDLEPPPLETDCLPIPAASEDPSETNGSWNYFELDHLGLRGSRIQIWTERTRAFANLSSVQLSADASGVRLKAPIIILEVPGEEPRVSERWADLAFSAEPGATPEFSENGYASIPLRAEVEDACVRIRFEEVGPLESGTTDPETTESAMREMERLMAVCETEGLARFETNVAPFMADRCVGCHGGGVAAARSVFDLTPLGDGDLAAACENLRERTDPARPAESAILSYFDPSGMPSHDRLSLNEAQFATFSAGIIAWLGEEE